MKTTIITGLVVVVIGLSWMLKQPAASTTTRSSKPDSLSEMIPPFLPAKSTTTDPDASEENYFTTQHLRLDVLSNPYRYQNLQLYPIIASSAFLDHHKVLGPYLSLKEGLEQKKLIITEVHTTDSPPADTTGICILVDDAEVNTLFIENISYDTIIILGGEVIQGGKQDRMIVSDFMLPPCSGKIDVAVYCVEHGRWTAKDEDLFFSVTPGIAPAPVREVLPSEQQPQMKVWEEVSRMNLDLKARSSTEALVEIMFDKELNDHIDPYLEFFNTIKWPFQVVGVVAVVGNEIVGCDIFAQHELFLNYYPDLVSSYCGKVHQHDEDVNLPAQDVQSFFTKIVESEASLEKHLSENGTQLKHKNYRLHVAAY